MDKTSKKQAPKRGLAPERAEAKLPRAIVKWRQQVEEQAVKVTPSQYDTPIVDSAVAYSFLSFEHKSVQLARLNSAGYKGIYARVYGKKS